jgi:teichuronic acid exporter
MTIAGEAASGRSAALLERVIRSVVYLLGSRIVLQGLSFVSTVLVARWLDPEDYGLMAIAGIFVAMINMLTELGVGAALIQFKDVSDAELNTAFWLTVAAAVLAYMVLYALAPWLSVFFAIPRLTVVLRITGLAAVLTVLRIVPESLLRKRLRLDRLSVAEVISTGATIPLTMGLAYGGAGVWALVAGSATAWLIQASCTFAFARWWPGRQVGSRRLRHLVRYSGAVLGSRLAWTAYSESDRAVLGRVAGDASLGFYAMAIKIALLPIEKVSVLVNQVAAPVFAEIQGDLGAMRACLLQSSRIVAWATLPVCVGTLLVAEDAIPLVLTEKWTPAVPVVQLLCLYAAIRSLAALFPPVLMASYRADFLLRYNLAMATVMPFGFGVGAWWAGALGVAAVWSIVYPLAAAVMVAVTLRHLHMPWRALWNELRRPLLATAVMAITAATTRQIHSDLGGEGPVRLALVVLIGVVVYGAAFRLLGGPVHQDVRIIFDAMRRRALPLAVSSRSTP